MREELKLPELSDEDYGNYRGLGTSPRIRLFFGLGGPIA